VEGGGWRVDGGGLRVKIPEARKRTRWLATEWARILYRTVQFSIQEQVLRSNEKQFQGGLAFKARRLLYHSTLGRE